MSPQPFARPPALPSLERLRAFAVFARHRNFTRAARELAISQPALHAQIARLTDVLGVALYRRDGRALALTPAGVEVACFARELLERMEAFHASIHPGRGDPARPVVLAAGEGAYLYVIDDAIGSFLAAERAPLRLITADRDRSVEVLRHGEAHLAVAVLTSTPEGIAAETITSVPQVLVVPDGHPLADRGHCQMADLGGMDLVVPPANRDHRRALDAALAHVGASYRVAVEATGWQLMLHFVQLGLGAAVVNGCCRLPTGFTGVPVRDLPEQTYCLLHRRTPLPAAAARLKALILQPGGS